MVPPPELLGNQAVRARLLDLLHAERLHPCLIFEGPPGVGKGATAAWLALVANCEEDDPAVRPCGACWSCRAIGRGQHPDVIAVGLDPTKTAAIISVEQARDVVGRLQLHPYRARRRFVILDPADAMNTGAANALLKTFEEPPSATGFILVTSAASKLLPTVRSRSQRVRFGPVSTGELAPWLAARGVDDAERVARLAEGCPGRALALAAGDVEAWRADRDALLDALAAPLPARFAYAELLVKGNRGEWGPRFDRTLDALARLLRDAMATQRGATGGADLYNADRPEVVEAWAVALGLPGINRLSAAVERARRDLDSFVNARLMADALLAAVVAELGPARRPGASP